MDKNQCCPEFIPGPWDGKVLEWNNKKFIKEKVKTFFYIPVNFGGVMKKVQKKAAEAGVDFPEYLCLSEHTSKWSMDIFLAVEKEVKGAENVEINGKFLSKVYEGNYRDTGKWCEDFQSYAEEKGYEIKKWYMWYTTCPKCAKKYGKNYVVIIGEV